MTDLGPTPPAGPEPPTAPPPAPLTPHRGVMILVFGILGIVFNCCFIFGILAWVMGNNDLREIEGGRMEPAGRDMTNIGRILGMIGVGLGVLTVVYWAIMAAIGGAMMPWRQGPMMRPY